MAGDRDRRLVTDMDSGLCRKAIAAQMQFGLICNATGMGHGVGVERRGDHGRAAVVETAAMRGVMLR